MQVMPTTVVADMLVAPRGRPGRSAQILGRFVAREHGRAFWATLWVAAAAADLAALAPLVYEEGAAALRARDVVFVLAAASFMACGLIAWRRRPDNHSGRLMTATGFAALLYPLLIQVDAPLAITLAMLFSSAWTIGYVALLLTFMTGGRLEGTIERLLVGVFTLTLVVAQLVLLLVLPVPDNLLLVAESLRFADAVDGTARWVTAAASIGVVVVLVSHWRGASKPQRRALLPGVVGIVSGILFSILLVQGIVADRPADALWIAANVALMLVPAAYLFGLLRSRLARTGLADLVLQLRTMHGAELEAALAKAIGDPGLRVVHGAVPPPAPGRSVARIERDGLPVAGLVYDESLDDDPELVEAVCAAAALALENEQLNAELQARRDELKASRSRIVEAGQKERQRLERNLHDGAQQRLVALSLQLTLLETELAGDPGARARVDEARREIAASLAELRELAHGLHPAVVSAHGLEVALEQIVARAPVPVKLRVETDGRLPDPLEVAAFYLVSESLANVGKYAQARSARVEVRREGGHVVVEVADDGVGGADSERGSGLRGLADRVEALDGRLQVWSPVGGGTRVRAELPCAS